MKLYAIYFEYGEHEPETEIFASEYGTVSDAKKYLLATYGGEDGYISDEKLLKDVTVSPFETVADSNGNPYKLEIKQ